MKEAEFKDLVQAEMFGQTRWHERVEELGMALIWVTTECITTHYPLWHPRNRRGMFFLPATKAAVYVEEEMWRVAYGEEHLIVGQPSRATKFRRYREFATYEEAADVVVALNEVAQRPKRSSKTPGA